jgi:stage V sporulation protein SpoVS
MSSEKKVLICSSKTNPQKLACAVEKELAKFQEVTIDAIGANSVNNAIKAVCYVNKRRKSFNNELPVYCHPIFKYQQVGQDEVQTFVSLRVR